ncbi:MAG TPA: ROK family protein [Anaerolineae bacterium]|nr:ROK family protein [Anaerolineae bacterium]HQI84974.1 ROK family protein [Anaerolineae bacterium]
MALLAGIDIGGTKCAVCLGQSDADGVTLLAQRRFPTPPTPSATLDALGDALAALLAERAEPLAASGVSCGGPLDSARGLILSPPNLPGWDRVDVATPFRARFGIPTALQNDANACALAEWQWGAGRGCRSMIFLTFGTGMGAGLIVDGRLYAGASDMAGEVGHVRLADDGPLGYGKRGSFEGFCSGGGIARLAQARALAALQADAPPAFCPTFADLPDITAEKVGAAAQAGDPLALAIFETVAYYLGRGLALLVDILNPERIVIGSIYGRQRALLEAPMLRVLHAEAHPHALAACTIVPAGLGERVGDYAGLAIAQQVFNQQTS